MPAPRRNDVLRRHVSLAGCCVDDCGRVCVCVCAYDSVFMCVCVCVHASMIVHVCGILLTELIKQHLSKVWGATRATSTQVC